MKYIYISYKIKENVFLLYLFVHVPAKNSKKKKIIGVYVCVSNIDRDYHNIISEREIIRVTCVHNWKAYYIFASLHVQISDDMTRSETQLDNGIALTRSLFTRLFGLHWIAYITCREFNTIVSDAFWHVTSSARLRFWQRVHTGWTEMRESIGTYDTIVRECQCRRIRGPRRESRFVCAYSSWYLVNLPT